jgi:hypothetical protein
MAAIINQVYMLKAAAGAGNKLGAPTAHCEIHGKSKPKKP